MGDRIFIRGLAVDCIIGRAEWERMVRQTVVLDLALWCEVREPARHDEVTPRSLDTKAVSKRLQSVVGDSDCRLVETLAERVCEVVVSEFPVRKVRLRLSKPGALRGARSVGVEVTREPRDYPL